ncbi:MAG: 16S rRNA (guanine(527)-N(7))-methyltransferase RsmG [Solirubrobacterales bacterium]|nr:16S rRNA (guanine(527)-N(7))-methyltransferase RsmG [Solirubrobacterales bacterium]
MEQTKLDQIAEWSVGLEISGTAVRSAKAARDIHVADSLAGIEVPSIQEAKSIVDIGSGAGFPGLVLAVALPDTQITLVDSVRKKMEAAARFAKELELENLECVWGRAEEVAAIGSPHREAYDVVTARALAKLGVLLEYSAPLLRENGHLVAWKGSPQSSELVAADAAGEILGFSPGELRSTQPFERSRARHFYVAKKSHPTDRRFPRRAGVALKRPLA